MYNDDAGIWFGNLPGLIVKIFLNNFDTGVFGGLYLFESAETMNNYVDGKTLVKTPDGDLNVKEFLSTSEQLCNQSFVKFSGSNI